ncbi:MAG: hypothetical protein MKZ66_10880 [Acidimicrobiales bacterium]|nr:hypothetical protein [Acidimicrobiales bacterium]
MSGDQAMRDLAASMPVPEFETTAFTTPSVPLGEARVAIVTSAALHRPSDDPFTATDTSFRTLAAGDRRRKKGLSVYYKANTQRVKTLHYYSTNQ